MKKDTTEIKTALQLLASADAALRLQAAVADPMAKLSIYWQIEEMDPVSCDLAKLERLALAAEDAFTRGYLHGIYLARIADRASRQLRQVGQVQEEH